MIAFSHCGKAALFLFVFQCFIISKCESNTSVESLTDQAKREQQLFKALRKYQEEKSIDLEKLQRKITSLENEYNKAISDAEDYLSNPINAYKLIKRTFIDWAGIHTFVVDKNATKRFDTEWKSLTKNMEHPSKSDVQNVIASLTTKKKSIDGAGGDLIYGSKIKWDECYDIGIRLYDNEDFLGAISWLELALEKVQDAQTTLNDEIKVDIMEYMAYSQYSLGDTKNALLIMEQLPDVPSLQSKVSDEKAFFRMQANNYVTKIKFGDPHSI